MEGVTERGSDGQREGGREGGLKWRGKGILRYLMDD